MIWDSCWSALALLSLDDINWYAMLHVQFLQLASHTLAYYLPCLQLT